MEEHDSIVIYCKHCGAMFYAVSNESDCLDDETCNEIKEYVRDGHKVATVDNDLVRAKFGGCTC